MTREIAPDGLLVLEPDECRRLLDRGGIGRLALPGASAPELRPVNFLLEGDAVVMRTGDGVILAAARRGDAVAFEIDAIDPLEHTGWSVLVTGKLTERAADAATRALPLRAWAPNPKDRYVSLALESVSGRRLPGAKGRT